MPFAACDVPLVVAFVGRHPQIKGKGLLQIFSSIGTSTMTTVGGAPRRASSTRPGAAGTAIGSLRAAVAGTIAGERMGKERPCHLRRLHHRRRLRLHRLLRRPRRRLRPHPHRRRRHPRTE